MRSLQEDRASRRARSTAYCRRCHATFARPLPKPYGSICPDCMARGDIVTLTDGPRTPMPPPQRPL
jgi:hypothetical protein